jgi:hypothetical protein
VVLGVAATLIDSILWVKATCYYLSMLYAEYHGIVSGVASATIVWALEIWLVQHQVRTFSEDTVSAFLYIVDDT